MLSSSSASNETGSSLMFTCEPCTSVHETKSILMTDCTSPGATLEQLPVLPGFWRQSSHSRHVRSCIFAGNVSCVGGTNLSQQCAPGYRGPLCNLCEAGYHGGRGLTCQLCKGDPAASIGGVLGISCSVILVFALLLARFKQSAATLFMDVLDNAAHDLHGNVDGHDELGFDTVMSAINSAVTDDLKERFDSLADDDSVDDDNADKDSADDEHDTNGLSDTRVPRWEGAGAQGSPSSRESNHDLDIEELGDTATPPPSPPAALRRHASIKDLEKSRTQALAALKAKSRTNIAHDEGFPTLRGKASSAFFHQVKRVAYLVRIYEMVSSVGVKVRIIISFVQVISKVNVVVSAT